MAHAGVSQRRPSVARKRPFVWVEIDCKLMAYSLREPGGVTMLVDGLDSGWVTAFATVGAALLVAVQVGREIRQEIVRRRTANARIRTIAYQLRRQLRSWVGDALKANTSTPGDAFDKWIRTTTAMETLGQHLDRAEERLDGLMALRPDAWRHTGLALDRAYVLFLEGTRHLNEYASGSEPSGARPSYDWARLRIDSLKELRRCITTLEDGVISPTVLTAERELAAQLDADDPLTRVVEAAFPEEEGA